MPFSRQDLNTAAPSTRTSQEPEQTGNELEVRLVEAFAPGVKKITYKYDFGAGWWHEIVLERVHERQPEATYPVCVAFHGDSPVEYWSEEDPQEPEPFDLAAVNRALTPPKDDRMDHRGAPAA